MKPRFSIPFGPNRPILTTLRSGLGKSAIIYPVSALHSISLGTTNLGLVYYLRDAFEAAPATVGIVAALFSVSYFIGCFVFRPFTRVMLPRVSLMLSVGVNSIFVTGILLAPSVAVVAIFNACFGFGVSFFWPPIMGWLSAGLEGKSLGRALARFNLSWSIGLIVSPYLAGILTEQHARLPLQVGAAGLLVVFVSVAIGSFALHRVRADQHREPSLGSESLGVDRSSPLRFPAWIGVVGAYIVMGIFGVVFPIHARSNLGLAEGTIGLVLLFRAVTTTLSFVLLGRLDFWHHRRGPMIASQLMLGAGCVALAIFDGLGVYLLVLPLFGVLMALSYSESVFHGLTGSPHRARRMAVHESLLVFGVVLGSTGGGFVFQSASIRVMFLITAAILAATTITQWVVSSIIAKSKEGTTRSDEIG